MSNAKPYDHRDKAGNAGDVWKRFILLSVTEATSPPRDKISQVI